MLIPFVGSSKTARSASANAERTVNCFLEMDQGSPRAPMALYGMPGLVLRATLASGPCRGSLADSMRWVFVAGSHVYSIASNYAVTDCGAITTSSGRVGMATNGTEVIIVDGTAGWLLTGNTLTQITDVDFPNGVTSVTYQDNYFLATGDGSQRVYWAENPGSGVAWNGTDFASAEGAPDGTTACISDGRVVWLFAPGSTEPWINTGDAAQLFDRDGNTLLNQGIASPWTAVMMDSTMYWLGNSLQGAGVVFRADGYTPRRISNHALETALAGYSTISDAFAYAFLWEGHSFYVLCFPTANKTWFFDASLGTNDAWFEWSWRDPSDNSENRHRSNCWALNNGKHLVGDWEDGKVYSLERETYTDNEDPIKRLRRTSSVQKVGKPLFFSNLVVDMETGVGTPSGDGSDPQLMLRYSDNDGRSWSNEKTRSMGQEGEYGVSVKFGGSLGRTKRGHGRVWEISTTDPVKFAVFGAEVDVVEGT